MRHQTRHGLTAVVLSAAFAAALAGCSAQGSEAPANQTTGSGSAHAEELDMAPLKASEPAAEALAAQPGTLAAPAKSELAALLDRHEVRSIRLIGDSLTAGYGCDGYDDYATTDRIAYDGPEGTYRETPGNVECWANEFRRFAESRGITDFVNAGVSGSKMWWLARSPESWLGEGADAVVVMLGTNDAVYSSPEQFEADSESALSAVAARCRCLVVMSPPANERTDATNLYGLDVIDERLRGVCERNGWCFVSLLGALDQRAGDLNDDLCHPTTQGSRKMWEAMCETLGIG